MTSKRNSPFKELVNRAHHYFQNEVKNVASTVIPQDILDQGVSATLDFLKTLATEEVRPKPRPSNADDSAFRSRTQAPLRRQQSQVTFGFNVAPNFSSALGSPYSSPPVPEPTVPCGPPAPPQLLAFCRKLKANPSALAQFTDTPETLSPAVTTLADITARRQEIAEVAQAILTHFLPDYSCGSVDIYAIAKAMDLHILFAEHIKDCEALLLIAGASGLILARSGANDENTYHRQRFTVAHEIAHAVLHTNAYGDSLYLPTEYFSKPKLDEELEANMLASALLMPANALKSFIGEQDFTPVLLRETTRAFQVSLQAASLALALHQPASAGVILFDHREKTTLLFHNNCPHSFLATDYNKYTTWLKEQTEPLPTTSLETLVCQHTYHQRTVTGDIWFKNDKTLATRSLNEVSWHLKTENTHYTYFFLSWAQTHTQTMPKKYYIVYQNNADKSSKTVTPTGEIFTDWETTDAVINEKNQNRNNGEIGYSCLSFKTKQEAEDFLKNPEMDITTKTSPAKTKKNTQATSTITPIEETETQTPPAMSLSTVIPPEDIFPSIEAMIEAVEKTLPGLLTFTNPSFPLPVGDYIVYTDGSATPNPGKGAYAAIIVLAQNKDKVVAVLRQAYTKTTNNRMEQRGPIAALEVISAGSGVKVYSDSEYVIKTIVNGNNMNLNKDLWKELLVLMKFKKQSQPTIKFPKATIDYVESHIDGKGLPIVHKGHYYNELCDRLAKDAASNSAHIPDTGYILKKKP